jgi:transketolase
LSFDEDPKQLRPTLRNSTMPTCLALSRQDLQYQARSETQIANIKRGGYILRAEGGSLKAVILATGSEVQIAVEAQQKLATQGISTRVVSMPSTTRFDRQDAAYRESVLGRGVPVVSVEAGSTEFWRKYVGHNGRTVGIDGFGESAPPNVLFEHFGMTVDAICQAVIGACDSKAA